MVDSKAVTNRVRPSQNDNKRLQLKEITKIWRTGYKLDGGEACQKVLAQVKTVQVE